MPRKLKETNISNEHNRLKNPNWPEAVQLAIYKHDRGVQLGPVHRETTPAKWSERDLNPWPKEFQVWRPNHSATLPHIGSYILSDDKGDYSLDCNHALLRNRKHVQCFYRVLYTVFPRINAAAFIKFFMIWVRRLFEGGVYSRAAFI